MADQPMANHTPEPDVEYLRGLAAQRQAAMKTAKQLTDETCAAVTDAYAGGDGMTVPELAKIFNVKRQQIYVWLQRQRKLVDELVG